MGKTVEVYDPERSAVVEVPEEQAADLEAAGYKVGPNAGLEERMNGWEGKLAAALMGSARKASFGASDAFVPNSLKNVQRHVEELHPVAKELGGLPAVMARQGLLAAAGGPAAAILGAGAAGGMEAATEAAKYQHPVTAERLVQGALWSAAMEGLAQGAAAAFKHAIPAGRAALTRLSKVIPRGAVDAGADELPELAGSVNLGGPLPEANPALTRLAPTGKFMKPLNGAAESALFLAAPKSVSLPILAANRGIPAALNRLDTVHGAFGEVMQRPMEVAGQVVKQLVRGTGDVGAAMHTRDVDKEYAAATEAVGRAANDPMALADTLDAQVGHVFEDHPATYGQASAHISAGASILNSLLPRNPNEPALTGNGFDPPRSMKAKWLHLYHGVSNPAALADPYPELIQVYKQMHPETLRMIQESLLSQLQDPEVAKNLTTAQARKISIILERPVRTETSKEFIGRLQKTATASSKQDQQSQAAGRPASAKVTNQVSTMDAPEMLQRQLGPQ